MYIVVTQHSAHEVNYKTFDDETEASTYYDEWNNPDFNLIHISISKVIKSV